jgi:hypothetical protein
MSRPQGHIAAGGIMSIKNSDDPIRPLAQCLNQLRHRVTLFYCQMKAVHILTPTFFQQKQICICKKKIISTQLALKAAQNSRGETGVTWLITFRGWKGWGANRPLVLATLIYEGVRLQRAGRLVTTSPVRTYTPFP